eukprot:CAMPEP_0202686972 /NCGR_PEP_ID=MMETSP1385-20130828/2705_1 /ASSEMBLY_ACC=CAM_ASM_000861 /TAXON_ID=933848 /ORGANISM="Elphidium margaritaceum" /LENGTH=906 /DNA_ID=CAMNT_0049341665 /DNA_START=168 /DNA_END=2885 /DNA_ORIENTATION=+
MHSPPRSFRSHSATLVDGVMSKDMIMSKDPYFATENPQIQYSSPPRKRIRSNSFGVAPHATRIHHHHNNHNHHNHNTSSIESPLRTQARACTLEPAAASNSNNHTDRFSSPISKRYRVRIIGGTLYEDEEQQSERDLVFQSPLRSRKRKRVHSVSPISHPINSNFNSDNLLSPQRCHSVGGSLHSPDGRRRHRHPHACDRYTPNHGGKLHRYELHSPTKRFVHNNDKQLMSSSHVIAPSPQKRLKLGQNCSGTNDDPSSLNHRLKQKLSQHTYNQVLQSELLGCAAEHSSIVNQVFDNSNNDITLRNDNISSIQMEQQQLQQRRRRRAPLASDADDDDADDDVDIEDGDVDIEELAFMSPTLANRRARRSLNGNGDGNGGGGEEKERHADNGDRSHHPLCPCHQQRHRRHRRDDPTSSSSSSAADGGGRGGSQRNADELDQEEFEAMCVCDSITSNVATNFLVSPQRTLRYSYDDRDDDQENIDDERARSSMAMTPLKPSSQSQLSATKRTMRNIAKSPFKVLDAPRLTDDFYLNLVDWSSSCNILSVGLGECVYLWSAHTSKVTKLCDLHKVFEAKASLLDACDFGDGHDMVCSVGWSKNHESTLSNCSLNIMSNTNMLSPTKQQRQRQQNNPSSNDYLAVGSGSGYVFVFDTVRSELVRAPLARHNHRVGALSWRDNHLLCSGSRDRNIYLRDIRIQDNGSDVVQELVFHKQEVCGLKWSDDSLYLASGGNDNKVAIWDIRYVHKHSQHATPTTVSSQPLMQPLCYGKHKAAVKAITWSPHESGLLATGGGTADRCIKFWNINAAISSKSVKKHAYDNAQHRVLKPMKVIDTGSQVCNLLWSKNCDEIVSTHGYSLNQIVVWKYPTMEKIVTLTGHTFRVLYLAGSPDGQTVVTGAGDETLRLW